MEIEAHSLHAGASTEIPKIDGERTWARFAKKQAGPARRIAGKPVILAALFTYRLQTVPHEPPLQRRHPARGHRGLSHTRRPGRARARRGERLAAVQDLIPPEMRAGVKAGPADGDVWCLLVYGSAAAAKLRQLAPMLQTRLKSRGWDEVATPDQGVGAPIAVRELSSGCATRGWPRRRLDAAGGRPPRDQAGHRCAAALPPSGTARRPRPPAAAARDARCITNQSRSIGLLRIGSATSSPASSSSTQVCSERKATPKPAAHICLIASLLDSSEPMRSGRPGILEQALHRRARARAALAHQDARLRQPLDAGPRIRASTDGRARRGRPSGACANAAASVFSSAGGRPMMARSISCPASMRTISSRLPHLQLHLDLRVAAFAKVTSSGGSRYSAVVTAPTRKRARERRPAESPSRRRPRATDRGCDPA